MRPAPGLFLCVLALIGGSACHHPSASPSTSAAPGPGASRGGSTKPVPSAPDVEFMQGMIGHHTQAIEMAALLKTRTTRDDMKLLGQRIEVAQTDEIKMMRNW